MTSWKRLAKGLNPWIAGGIGSLMGMGQCLAQPGPAGDNEVTQIRGNVVRMTTAPKGEVDGAVLDSGTLLHWPPHLERRFSQVIQAGDRVEASGRTETAPRGEVHFEVEKVTNLKTNATAENDDFDDGPPPPPRHRRGRPGPPPHHRERGVASTARGVAERLTTAPKGEIDGVMLSDGTWLHWPPHLEDHFSKAFKIGDTLEAHGFKETAPRGEVRFEVSSLTNTRTSTTVQNPDLAERPTPGEARALQERGSDREQRLRELQVQIDRLQRELARLRDER